MTVLSISFKSLIFLTSHSFRNEKMYIKIKYFLSTNAYLIENQILCKYGGYVDICKISHTGQLRKKRYWSTWLWTWLQ